MKKRLYYISNHNNVLEDFETVPPAQIPNIVNTSVDRIYLDHINMYTSDDAVNFIVGCVSKLRPQGILSINLYNIANICKSYLDKSITDNVMADYLCGCQSILSVDSVIEILQKLPVDLSEINYSDNKFTVDIVCQRK